MILHFPYLMDHKAVITIIKFRAMATPCQAWIQSLVTTHQVDQALDILEYRPGIMQAIAFRECITHFSGLKRRLKLCVFILPRIRL